MDIFSDYAHTLPFALPQESENWSCHWSEQLQGFEIFLPQGQLFFAPNFFNQKISDRSVEYFLENHNHYPIDTDWKSLVIEEFEKIDFTNIHWKQQYINLFGRKPLPRMTAWYGDSGKSYSYSGIIQHPHPWNKGLLYIKDQIEDVTNVNFNSVLLNWYRNGEDHQGWHADNEPELGINPVIASVNFGQTRDFQLRYNADKSLKLNIPLAHGTLLIMSGELQHYWQHCVPKRKRVTQSRFNLTFRVVNEL